MSLDYYAYWNGEAVRDLFEAVTAICGGGDFTGLIKTAALIGFLTVLTLGAMRFRGIESIGFAASFLLFYTVFLLPRTDLTIHDTRAETVHVVQNVPLGIGFTASLTSTAGAWLTEAFETAFSDTDEEKFSRFGAVFPERVLETSLKAGFLSAQGRSFARQFNENCLIPELIDHPGKADELFNSGDIFESVSAPGWLNPARVTASPDGTALSCTEALEAFSEVITRTEVPLMRERLALKLLPERADPSLALESALPASEALLLNLSRTLSESLRHIALQNALKEDAMGYAGSLKRPIAMAASLAAAQGNLASEINYRSMAKIAENALPKIRNALEFVTIAAFPLLFVLCAASGAAGFALLRNYLTILIWIALWAPVSSVINYLMVHTDASALNRVAQSYGGESMAAIDLIREFGASSQSIAGYLMILTPVIAFAIAKGSDFAAVQLAGAFAHSAQGASGAAGAQLSAGNASFGNVSWGNASTNNTSANKADASAFFTDPGMLRTADAYGSVTRTESGSVTGVSATGISMGVSARAAFGERSMRTGTELKSSSETLSASASGASTAGSAQKSAQSAAKGESFSASRALSDINEESRAGAQRSSITQSLTQRTELSSAGASTENLSYASRAGLLGGGGAQTGAAKAGASSAASRLGILASGLSIANGDTLTHSALSAEGASSAQTSQKAYETLMKEASRIASTSESAQTSARARSFMKELSSARRSTLQAQAAQSAQKNLAAARLNASSESLLSEVSQDPMALSLAVSVFGSPEEALKNLYHSPRARAGFARRLLEEAGAAAPIQKENLPAPKDAPDFPAAPVLPAADAPEAPFKGTGGPGALNGAEPGAAPYARAPSVPSPAQPSVGADDIALMSGATRLAGAAFEGSHGMARLAGTSFLFGLGYVTPKEFKGAILEKAREDSSFADAVRRLAAPGTSPKDEEIRDLLNSFKRK